MASQPNPFVTIQQYVREEEMSEVTHEYLGGEVFEMEATTLRHGEIVTALVVSLSARLKDRGCKVYSQKTRLAVASDGLVTYPDILIVCGKVSTSADDPNAIVNPKVLFEVLSPSTRDYDRGEKSVSYRTIPSLSDYVLVHQDSPFIEHLFRRDGQWALQDIRGLDSTLRLEALGIEIPFTAIFPPED